MKISPRIHQLHAGILIFAALLSSGLAQGPSALGNWEFDSARKAEYVKSVRQNQIDQTSMAEIASQMGVAQMQKTEFEFGFNDSGPFLITKDRASGVKETRYLTVQLKDKELHMVDKATGDKLRMVLIDNDHMTLIDESKKQRIPLKRV